MKKIVIAAVLAVASLTTMAQVTVYGRLNATVDHTKTGATSVHSIVNDISHLGFRVEEKLANGVSARAVIETSVVNQDPLSAYTKLGNRQSTVGLASAQGSVDIGRNVHGVFAALAAADAFGALHGTIAGDIHNLRGTRLSNGMFARVTAIPGLTLGMDRTYTDVGHEATVYLAATKLGPAQIRFAEFDQGAERSRVVAADTKLGPAHVFYSYSDNRGVLAYQGHMVSLSHPMGPYTVKASYGRTNHNVQAYNLGAEYALSPRTHMLVSYRNVDLPDVKQIGLGITHRF